MIDYKINSITYSGTNHIKVKITFFRGNYVDRAIPEQGQLLVTLGGSISPIKVTYLGGVPCPVERKANQGLNPAQVTEYIRDSILAIREFSFYCVCDEEDPCPHAILHFNDLIDTMFPNEEVIHG